MAITHSTGNWVGFIGCMTLITVFVVCWGVAAYYQLRGPK